MAEDAAAHAVVASSETRRNRLPYTFGNAVVLGQPLVHERVVRAQQVERAAVLRDDALDEQLGLAPERLAQVVVEVGERPRVRARRGEVPQIQPLAGEVGDERLGLRIRQHALHLLLERRRPIEPPAIARSSSSSSGTLLHRKNDSARRARRRSRDTASAARRSSDRARCGTGTRCWRARRGAPSRCRRRSRPRRAPPCRTAAAPRDRRR